MKTVKETIAKWNEMYELVFEGATDINNASWKKMQSVFMLSDKSMNDAKNIVNEFVEKYSELTQEDIDNENDWPLVMKCIGDLLVISINDDYLFYIYDGEVGVIYDDEFVPGYDMATKLSENGDDTPQYTYDDSYACYGGCTDIDERTVKNVENDQRTICTWVSVVYADSDEYTRELLTLTTQYHDWTSERTRKIEAIEQTIDKYNDELSFYNGVKDDELEEGDITRRDMLIKHLKESIKIHIQSWNNTCNNYCDPLGWRNNCDSTTDFKELYEDAKRREPIGIVDDAITEVINESNFDE